MYEVLKQPSEVEPCRRNHNEEECHVPVGVHGVTDQNPLYPLATTLNRPNLYAPRSSMSLGSATTPYAVVHGVYNTARWCAHHSLNQHPPPWGAGLREHMIEPNHPAAHRCLLWAHPIFLYSNCFPCVLISSLGVYVLCI